MSTQIFVNLPVKDLNKSVEFFTKLGYKFNPKFNDENATCMIVAEFKDKPSDKGPFYHGTKADLQVGDLLTAGGSSNYKLELKMNHIYFTALVNGAGLAVELGLMSRFPPLLDRLVTHDNQLLEPYNRWSFQNELKLNLTADVLQSC
jgi:Rifampin ADP-ribosyl transferase